MRDMHGKYVKFCKECDKFLDGNDKNSVRWVLFIICCIRIYVCLYKDEFLRGALSHCFSICLRKEGLALTKYVKSKIILTNLCCFHFYKCASFPSEKCQEIGEILKYELKVKILNLFCLPALNTIFHL